MAETQPDNSTQDYHMLSDAGGNVVKVLNADDLSVANEYEYGPFGQTIAKTETVDNPYQYNTKYHDEETGLLYYGYRFYDAEHGRWVNRDPIGYAGGINVYNSVSNNMVNGFSGGISLIGGMSIYEGGISEQFRVDSYGKREPDFYDTYRGLLTGKDIINHNIATRQKKERERLEKIRIEAKVKENGVDLTISFAEDWETKSAGIGEWADFTFTKQGLGKKDGEVPRDAFSKEIARQKRTDGGDWNWEHKMPQIETYLKKLKKEGKCLKNVWLTGHGSAGRAFDHGIGDLYASGSPFYKFLKLIGKYKCKNSRLRFNSCETAAQDPKLPRKRDGIWFLQRVAKISNMYTIGFDDIYAVMPHGREILVSPNGKHKVIKIHPPYTGHSQSLGEFLFNYPLIRIGLPHSERK